MNKAPLIATIRAELLKQHAEGIPGPYLYGQECDMQGIDGIVDVGALASAIIGNMPAALSKPHVATEIAKPSLSTDGIEGLNISINDYVKGVVRDIVCSADWYRDAEQEEKSKLTIDNLCIRPVMVSSGRTHTLENCFTADVTFMGELKRVAWRLEFTHGRIIEAT